MKNRFLSAGWHTKMPVGRSGFFPPIIQFLLTRINRVFRRKKLFFSKKDEKNLPVGPFEATRAVDRKQLFI